MPKKQQETDRADTGEALNGQDRKHYIDFLRGIMMILGIFVHASHSDYDMGNFSWIRDLSGAFRMACFFIIAGYFTQMSLARKAWPGYIVSRMINLGVPALFCICVLNPPTILLMKRYYSTAPVAAQPVLPWYMHVWFLLSLVAYSGISPILSRLCKKGLRLFTRKRTQIAWAFLFLFSTIVSAILGTKAIEKFRHILPDEKSLGLGGLLQTTVSNLPYFIFGMYLFLSEAAFELVHRAPLAWATASCLVWVMIRYTNQAGIDSFMMYAVSKGLEYGLGFLVSFFILGLAKKVVRGPSRPVQYISKSAYTLYILHYLPIAVVLNATQRYGFALPYRFVLASGAAIAFGLLVYELLVKRVPGIAFVLNGALPQSGKRPAGR